MLLIDLVGKTCVIGLSYFDVSGELLKQSQLCGRVTAVDHEAGISVTLLADSTSGEKLPIFVLPPVLSPWYHAPAGQYRAPSSGGVLDNPDYLVTWDIHKTKKETSEGQHEWWDWVPREVQPSVGPG